MRRGEDLMAVDYYAHEREQRLAAGAAWDGFFSKAANGKRAALEKLPAAEISFPVGDLRDSENSARLSYVPDIAMETDSSVDELMDLGLTREQAAAVREWHEQRARDDGRGLAAQYLYRALSLLCGRTSDVRAKLSGLMLAAGLTGETSLNGFHSGADVAKSCGKHRATISYWKRYWQKLLGLTNETFGKSDAAKSKYSEARRRVVAKGRKK